VKERPPSGKPDYPAGTPEFAPGEHVIEIVGQFLSKDGQGTAVCVECFQLRPTGEPVDGFWRVIATYTAAGIHALSVPLGHIRMSASGPPGPIDVEARIIPAAKSSDQYTAVEKLFQRVAALEATVKPAASAPRMLQ
jgi:hypothetical protein